MRQAQEHRDLIGGAQDGAQLLVDLVGVGELAVEAEQLLEPAFCTGEQLSHAR
jgi:hypothetical protein